MHASQKLIFLFDIPTPAEPEVIPPKEATPPPPPIPPVEDKGASDIESDQVIFSVLYYAFI
jgi:hypothetical protein